MTQSCHDFLINARKDLQGSYVFFKLCYLLSTKQNA